MTETHPRDLAGYGPNPPLANWPHGARIALQRVLNCEEGRESCILHGDNAPEALLSDMVGAEAGEGGVSVDFALPVSSTSTDSLHAFIKAMADGTMPSTCQTSMPG